MKISKSKCNSKTPPKINLILIQSKIPFECTKSVALRYYFQIFIKSHQVVLEKSSLHLTSPMKISKSKCNRKPPKIPFNFDSIKNSFWVHKASAIKILFPDFHKSYRVIFEKSSLYFTSPMKISKSKCNRKKPKNPFNFDSNKNSFWLHIVNGI